MEYLYKHTLSKVSNYTPVSGLWDGLGDNISDDAKKYLIGEAENYIAYSFPSIPATLFMDFKRTGNRIRFEDVYFGI